MFYFKVFYGELPSKYGVKAVRSCVDFVLSKLFQQITIACELLRDGILKLHAIWASMEREFLGQHLGLPYL